MMAGCCDRSAEVYCGYSTRNRWNLNPEVAETFCGMLCARCCAERIVSLSDCRIGWPASAAERDVGLSDSLSPSPIRTVPLFQCRCLSCSKFSLLLCFHLYLSSGPRSPHHDGRYSASIPDMYLMYFTSYSLFASTICCAAHFELAPLLQVPLR